MSPKLRVVSTQHAAEAAASSVPVEWLVENTGPLPVVVNVAISASAAIVGVGVGVGRAEARGRHGSAVISLAGGARTRVAAMLERDGGEPAWADLAVASVGPADTARLAAA